MEFLPFWTYILYHIHLWRTYRRAIAKFEELHDPADVLRNQQGQIYQEIIGLDNQDSLLGYLLKDEWLKLNNIADELERLGVQFIGFIPKE